MTEADIENLKTEAVRLVVLLSKPLPDNVGWRNLVRIATVTVGQYAEDIATKMTEYEYLCKVGRKPQHDDLDRVNCHQVGNPGHSQCGVCEHGYPKFLICDECQGVRANGTS